MFLNSSQIQETINSGKVKISPFSPEHLKPASYTFRLSQDITIQPGEFINLISMEEIEFPNDIGGILSTRGSIARLGLDCLLSDYVIEPGSKGKLTFSTFNHSADPIVLKSETPIVKCLFFLTSE